MTLKLPVEAQLTTRTNNLRVRVECVVRVASLLDINPFIHGNPNISSCFRYIVGYPSFKIQTVIGVIYSPKDLFLLSDGSETSRQYRLLNQPRLFHSTQYLLGMCSCRNTKKLLLQTFLYISGMFWVGEI